MKHVVMSLQFADVLLPITKDSAGRDVVPLKPISDVFGLDWSTQKRKKSKKRGTCGGYMPPAGADLGAKNDTWTPCLGGAGSDSQWFSERLGLCLANVSHGGQAREMVCIRVDRVAAFLNTINPAKVRATGNTKGAEVLARKQAEWDDLIHEYEMAGGMFSRSEKAAASARIASIRAFIAVSKEKRSTSNEADRKALNDISARLATDLGVPYQFEMSTDRAA